MLWGYLSCICVVVSAMIRSKRQVRGRWPVDSCWFLARWAPWREEVHHDVCWQGRHWGVRHAPWPQSDQEVRHWWRHCGAQGHYQEVRRLRRWQRLPKIWRSPGLCRWAILRNVRVVRRPLQTEKTERVHNHGRSGSVTTAWSDLGALKMLILWCTGLYQ